MRRAGSDAAQFASLVKAVPSDEYPHWPRQQIFTLGVETET